MTEPISFQFNLGDGDNIIVDFEKNFDKIELFGVEQTDIVIDEVGVNSIITFLDDPSNTTILVQNAIGLTVPGHFILS